MSRRPRSPADYAIFETPAWFPLRPQHLTLAWANDISATIRADARRVLLWDARAQCIRQMTYYEELAGRLLPQRGTFDI
jgi:hypothetical protein